ncbi:MULTISPECIES: acetyl-CoA hydrolase/transferase family protein [Delftia]|jgi:succinyl-CoA:acetate CoA-transferase|uniref:Succinate CoA transferase n=7 Tax=Pseudomonadati TaxID=3379134 RepID=A9BQN0_DELAS|nr:MULTISPECIES: acetyl-CoA hydrolase/transferase family protein [Delftia]OLE95204.1 MAG: propionyl-CoA--succinate CoA transferase [Delftia sp. 13_1_40CM_3_66_6]PIF35364.1 succinyl-CoA:acetate CoA-transferase [Burkholderiales bacterium 23]ABX32732.1 succinate CoA transferase [Delftia acidovorans SPH-1]AOV03855.1 acetyl-CoA hydrolase [Delftia tsuruhatensis]APE46815.1 propionyl-CoA--succinate CoA transferase [Delftia sp. HK171]
MSLADRVRFPEFLSRTMTAEQAAALIPHGVNVGMSGFTGAGYPKALPQAIAQHAKSEHAAGRPYKINVWTGASTAAEMDGALAEAGALGQRLPFNTDPTCRARINAGEIDFIDMHLSHVAQHAWFGFLGPMSVAVVEVLGVTEDGRLIPSTAVGNNKTWLEIADKVILEVNTKPPAKMEGMHDIYYGTAIPPRRVPIALTHADDRIGEPYLRVDPAKVVAVVETHKGDRDNVFAQPDANSNLIAASIIDFLAHEMKMGRLPKEMLPIQSGVGNVANAVLAGLLTGPFENLLGFTEVLQDGMLDLLRAGKMSRASATSISLSGSAYRDFEENIDFYRERIILRPQEISNHPELVRRLGVIAMNSMIEADIYGNINSTHVMGTGMMNGIGGSGDFARNGYLSFFVTPSVAKGGKISCIVPMCSHVDHTEHDTQIIVTEQGLADLRGLSPRKRAQVIIDRCAHPDFRPQLQDYFDRAQRQGALHTPHILGEALSWHQRFVETGDMRA